MSAPPPASARPMTPNQVRWLSALAGVSPEWDCVGRKYFLVDPQESVWVLVSDVRKLHPEIPDEEWEELMRAAAARDDSPDAIPLFHRYRGRPQSRKEDSAQGEGLIRHNPEEPQERSA